VPAVPSGLSPTPLIIIITERDGRDANHFKETSVDIRLKDGKELWIFNAL
jgi:hypothetical protein